MMEEQAKLANNLLDACKHVKTIIDMSPTEKVLSIFKTDVDEQFPAYTKQAYIPRGFEEKLCDHITFSACGVKIISAANGSGKSIVVTHIAKELCKKETVKGVCIIKDYSGSYDYDSFTQWLLEKQFGVSFKDMQCITSVLPEPENPATPKPYLLVLDQFDDAFHHRDIVRATKVLAQNCHLSSKLNVIVTVKSESQVETMLEWNGRTKIVPIREDITMPESILVKFGKEYCDWNRWETPESKDDVIIKASLTRNPGFMIEVRDNPSFGSNELLLEQEIKKKRIEMGLIDK